MAIATATQIYTAEDYLASEVQSDSRHEFRHGEIVEMTGRTPEHNEITRMFVFLLTAALRKQAYSIFFTDQRVWIPEVNLYTYPDAMITPKPLELKPGRNDTVVNPLLIAETLSQSTQNYDRGDKFAAYRTLESLQEYVLIDQYRPQVDHYAKQSAHQWLLTTYRGLEARFKLAAVEVEIALADLYEAVEFED
ncbi:MAG: Uma2 family endonuclease [Leptolyngbyaceae cyanobacterium SL_1_1]|nr:Uma2 family endonuclease [Leptolyngbyaceae cyanobacterium RM1_1_2]NJO10318.1 Uma2 family endonuclease [Leptolyngbyaceae cyanobacterium SL_1_1]